MLVSSGLIWINKKPSEIQVNMRKSGCRMEWNISVVLCRIKGIALQNGKQQLKISSQLENILRNPSAPLKSHKSVCSPVWMSEIRWRESSTKHSDVGFDNTFQEPVLFCQHVFFLSVCWCRRWWQIITYHYYPQNTADHKHKVPETIQFCQLVLQGERNRWEESHWSCQVIINILQMAQNCSTSSWSLITAHVKTPGTAGHMAVQKNDKVASIKITLWVIF